jgi:hypothetical protein
MYDLTDFDSYKEYFELISEEHLQIDGFAYGDQDVQNNEIRTWKGKRLWLWPYGPVRIEDNRSDNYLQRKEGSLFIGGAAPSAKYEDEDVFLNDCEAIVKSLISRILKDLYEQKIVTRLNGYSFERVVLTGSTRMIGCELKFFFYDPSGFEYDESQWLQPEPEPEPEED